MIVLGGALAAAHTVSASPHIFNVTKKANPGDVISIQGSGFSENASVWVDVINPGETATAPDLNLPQLLLKSDTLINLKLPDDLSAGMYAVYVSDGVSMSDAGWVNKAEGWHYLDLAGSEISPNFTFRISGKNLVSQSGSSQVRFVNTANGTKLAGFVDDSASSDSVLVCLAPPTLVAGQEYYVEVCNGPASFAGAWARVNGSPLIARVGGTDVFGLGVPWASDATKLNNLVINAKTAPFNAVGNGVADDRYSIQLAMDYVASRGGGTVYLPAGTYKIGVYSASGVDFNLIMRSNVVLKGEGMNQTTIITQGANTGFHAGVIYVLPSQRYVGLHSMTVIGGTRSLMTLNGLNNSRSFAVNVRFINDGGASTRTIGWTEGGGSVFKGCEFVSNHAASDAPYFARHHDLVLKDCFFEYHDGRVNFLLSKRVQVEGCTFARSVSTSPSNNVNYGGVLAPITDFSMIGSSFVKLGEGEYPYGNDGEAVLCEYPSNNFGLGNVSNATSNSFQDKSAAWQTNRFIGMEVVIIRGPGTGQRRTIAANSANTLVVSQPWTVQPVAGESAYSIGEFCERHLVKDCIFNASPRGIWYYRSPMKDLTITGNSFMNTAYPVLVRANQRVLAESYSLGNEFNTITNLLVENNIAQTSPAYVFIETVTMTVDTVMTSGSSLMGGFYYDSVLRDNIVCGDYAPEGSGFFIAHASSMINNTQPSSIGTILQRNTVQGRRYGISLGTGNHKSVVWGNQLSATPELLRDTVLPYHSTASVETVVGQ